MLGVLLISLKYVCIISKIGKDTSFQWKNYYMLLMIFMVTRTWRYNKYKIKVIKTTFQLCQVLNKQGIICLQKRDFEKSYTYLKRAEELSKDNK